MKMPTVVTERTTHRYCTILTRIYAKPILSKKNSSQPQLFPIKGTDSAVEGIRNGLDWFSARDEGMAIIGFP
jgi:hypothetical protein